MNYLSFKHILNNIIIISTYLISLSNAIEIIQNTKILLSSSFTHEVPYQKCVEFLIPNSYKKISLQLSTQNIDKTILTDAKLIKCNDNPISLCCANNASFCMENINPSKHSYNVNYCLESSYLYACVTNLSNNLAGSINVETEVVKGQGCQIAEFSEETECSNLGANTCRDQSKCHHNCQYVECLRSNMTKIFSMCLPVNYTKAEIIDRCSNHIDFEENNNEQMMKMEKCSRPANTNDIREQSSSHKFFKCIAVVFGVFSLGLFMSSVYYRFKMSMDVNRPPFNPPWFCPNFIFPRVNPNSLL